MMSNYEIEFEIDKRGRVWKLIFLVSEGILASYIPELRFQLPNDEPDFELIHAEVELRGVMVEMPVERAYYYLSF